MAIAEGILAAKAAFDVGKEVIDLLKFPQVDSEKVMGKVLELQQLVLSTQAALSEAREDNAILIRRLEDRNRFLSFGNDFIYEEGVYWRESYPYCPNCWNLESKPTRLDGPEPVAYEDDITRWKCAFHASVYRLKRRAVWN